MWLCELAVGYYQVSTSSSFCFFVLWIPTARSGGAIVGGDFGGKTDTLLILRRRLSFYQVGVCALPGLALTLGCLLALLLLLLLVLLLVMVLLLVLVL